MTPVSVLYLSFSITLLLAASSKPLLGATYGKTRSTYSLELMGSSAHLTPTVNLFGLPVYRDLLLSGPVQSVDRDRLRFRPGQFAEDLFDFSTRSYFVEIISGPNRGITADIIGLSEESMTIEVAENFTRYLRSDDQVRVGAHHTLFSIFGIRNKVGVLSGDSAEGADELIIFDARSQTPRTYFYSSTLKGWANAGQPDKLTADVIFHPGQGLFFRRKSPEALIVRFSGKFIDDGVGIPIEPGVNVVSDLQRGTGSEPVYLSTGYFMRSLELARADSPPTGTASEVPSLTTTVEDSGRVRFIGKHSSMWYAAVGLHPDERVNIVFETAYILEEPEESGGYILIPDDDA